jgi:hypothetical protein
MQAIVVGKRIYSIQAKEIMLCDTGFCFLCMA